MTVESFLLAYQQGQRYFKDLEFEYVEGFSHASFRDIIFDSCVLYVEFCNSDLTNAQFTRCNIKEINLKGANLTDALMTKCSVENAAFLGAIMTNFRFEENYAYGGVFGQEDLALFLKHEEKMNIPPPRKEK